MKYIIMTTINSGYWWEDRWASSQENEVRHRLPTVRVRTWATARANVIAVMEGHRWEILQENATDRSMRERFNTKVRPIRMWMKDLSETVGIALCVLYDDKTGEIQAAPQEVSGYVKGEDTPYSLHGVSITVPVGVSSIKEISKERSAFLRQVYTRVMTAKSQAFREAVSSFRPARPVVSNNVPALIAANNEVEQ